MLPTQRRKWLNVPTTFERVSPEIIGNCLVLLYHELTEHGPKISSTQLKWWKGMDLEQRSIMLNMTIALMSGEK